MELVWGYGNRSLLKISISFLLVGLHSPLYADISTKNFKKIEKKYFEYHKNFHKKTCRPGSEEKFNKLYKDYLGLGIFIPVLPNSHVDLKTIQENISLLRDKIVVIQSNIEYLKDQFHQGRSTQLLIDLMKDVENLALIKTRYKLSNDKLFLRKSRQTLRSTNEKLLKLYDSIPFLLPILFPVDLLELRRQYDDPKNRNNKSLRNKIFFIRKVVEDGAQELDSSKSDKFLRALLGTVYLRFKKESDFLSDEVYYDLNDLKKGITKQLKYGRNRLVERQNEWLERTKRVLLFYKQILKDKDSSPEKIEKYLGEQKLARRNLQNYVQEKQSQVYSYWSLRPKLYRSLFAIEMILMNEVGTLDVRGALEREEIIRVIKKRTLMDEYSLPAEGDTLFKRIQKKIGKKYEKLKWLNVLFKRGEFSFTYYFIHASVRTFCPEQTRRGKKLRRENVKLAIESLDSNKKTSSVRYFSRASMLGRINMHEIWDGFTSIGQKPGMQIFNKSEIIKEFDKKNFFWLYDIEHEGKKLWAIEVFARRYYVNPEDKTLFDYRNPYYFTYFKEKTLN